MPARKPSSSRSSRSTREARSPGSRTRKRPSRPRGGSGRGGGGRVAFPEIAPRAWEHPADAAALVALKKVPGFDLVVRKLFGLLGDRPLRLMSLASAVRVTERQFADVHALYGEACRILDVESPPELFVAQTPLVNAGTIGVDEPFIVVNSGSLNLLDEGELQFVLAHELGHALSGHALYKTMLQLLLRLTFLTMSVPLGGVALWGLLAALLEWDRKSELSADRAGLLVAQDLRLAQRVNMKLAGGGNTEAMSLDEFAAQAREYEESGTLVDSVMKVMSLMGQTHPFPVLRLGELGKWVESGGYDAILEGDYPRRSGETDGSVFGAFREAARQYRRDVDDAKDPLGRTLSQLADQLKDLRDDLADFFSVTEHREE